MKHILCRFIESQTWPSMNQNRFLIIQTQTLFGMHHKWKENCRFCMQNNQWIIIGDQLTTKTPIELNYNSIRNVK